MILDKFGTRQYGGFTIPNLFVDLNLNYDLIKSNFILREYTITGAPRPEQLSYRIYGSTEYDWVLLLINGVTDPWHGWIRPDDVVRESSVKMYEHFGGPNGIHHYYDPITQDEYYDVVNDGNDGWYNSLDTDMVYKQFQGVLIPVTNSEFEISKNERLRKIKIIKPSDIKLFVSSFVSSQNANN